MKTNDNEDIGYQNLWNTGKVVIREILIALQEFIRKKGKTNKK